MGPFRDEHEASHARIAQLEKQKEELELRNRELEGKLKQERSGSRWLHPAWLVIISTVAMGLITATAVFIGTVRPVCFDPTGDPTRPILDKVPSPFGPPKPQDASACTCAQGDPLCSCL